jgi:Ca2+-binding EF-hand superfamily protein
MRLLIAISALAVALGSSCAVGHDNDKHRGSTAQFESLDRNSDQKLSQQEASSDQQLSSQFAALDVDSDGYVTKREYMARMQKDQQAPPHQPMRPDEPRNPY